MPRHYRLTQGAAQDIADITRYTSKQWGAQQARTYLAKLEQVALHLTDLRASSRHLHDIHPQLFVHKAEHHYIFYLQDDTAPTLILAILHERMDLMRRLQQRLDVTAIDT